MAYPEYKEMVEPVLCFIYFNGDQNFAVRPRDTYQPLADFFKLTKQERIQPREDKRSGKEWDNIVQWTRQKLINDGELYDVAVSGRGFWRLTPKGLSRAKNVCFKYEGLKGRQKHKDETVTAEVRITPHVSVTLDNNASQTVHSSQTPIATDIAEPPMRVQTETYRILRDTKLAREVKESNGFQCQICSNPPLKLSYVNFYAEAHHIKPLGSPHNGPDVRENILCVCPNCHVLLDYGAIKLDRQGVSSNHTIGDEYVDYHNDHIYRKFEIKP